MKSLVVEDEELSRTLLRELLSSCGEVNAAENGKAGIDAFRQALEERVPYDLVCLDIMMPDMDGLSVLQMIRVIEKSRGITKEGAVKVIMTTALSDRKNVLEACRKRCDAYLIKPIHKEKLYSKLEELGFPDESIASDSQPAEDTP